MSNEKTWRALAIQALGVEASIAALCDALSDAERFDLACAAGSAEASVADVRRACEGKLAAEATSVKAYTRWSSNDDDFLARCWGPALREFKGDTEAAVAALAGNLKRSPVAVAARLVKQEIWN